MQCANCIGWNCGNEGNVTSEGEKKLCSPKCRAGGVYFFVINAFKKKFFVLLMFIKCFCVYILFCLLLSNFFGFCRLALFLRMWGVLVFRSAKWWLPPLVVLVWMVWEPSRVPVAGDLVK